MSSHEWFAVVAPEDMLDWVAPRCMERKLRLIAVAYCRRVAHVCRQSFEATLRQGEAIAEASTGPPTERRLPRLHSIWMNRKESALARALSNPSAYRAAQQVGLRAITLAKTAGDTWGQERWFQACILCDIIGDPNRSVTPAPECLTDTVVALAREMYDSRDFSAMPILADALEEAGCEDGDILNHCRDVYGVHFRGCWLVDRILGKE